MAMDVTDAFQQQLSKRRQNIYNMFKNPEDALDDSGIDKAVIDDIEKGCGGKNYFKQSKNDDIKKEEDFDETEEDEVEDETEDSEENEDEKDDAKKAELISLIGIKQLDIWKSDIDEIAANDLSTSEYYDAVKAIESDIANFSDVNGIEKSDILYALSSYGNDKIRFKKSGKEIKTQLTTSVIPLLNSELTEAKTKMETLLSDCGDAPTHDCPEYWTGDLHIELPYKYYEWEETRVKETNDASIVASFSPDSYQKTCCKNIPATQDEADARCAYNEQLRKVANIITDVKACEIVTNNLKDNEQVSLSVKQLIAFKFA